MKVAIIGNGPLGMEMALKLNEMGAGVRVFGKNNLGGKVPTLVPHFKGLTLENSWEEVTSSWGRELLKSLGNESWGDPNFLEKKPTFRDYWESYLKPLTELDLWNNWVFEKAEVVRVQKKFFSPGEEGPTGSRLKDLFRVVYQKNLVEQNELQNKENPELLEKLPQNVRESLDHPIEYFEDFDLVVDARGALSFPNPLGASNAPAVNELYLKGSEDLEYGIKALSKIGDEGFKGKELAIVGQGLGAQHLILSLKEWCEKEGNYLHIVTQGLDPFQELPKGAFQEASSDHLQELFSLWEERHQEDRKEFEQNLANWETLENYEKAKIRRPDPPRRKIQIHPGFVVSSIDRLVDNSNIFLTIEKISHEPNEEITRTLRLDTLIGAQGYHWDQKIYHGLRTNFNYDGHADDSHGIHPEPGLYTLHGIESGKGYMEKGIDQISKVIDDMMRFFSRA